MVKKIAKVNPIQDKLVKAIADGDLKKVNKLLADGADVNGPNKYGMTPLLMSVSCHNVEIVETLLKAGADPNLGVEGYVDYGYKLPTYDTPLHFADWDTDSSDPELAKQHQQMVDLLKQYGATN